MSQFISLKQRCYVTWPLFYTTLPVTEKFLHHMGAHSSRGKAIILPGTSSFNLVLEFNLIHHLIMQEPCIKFMSSDYTEDLCESYQLKIVSTVSSLHRPVCSPILYVYVFDSQGK